MTGIEVKAGLGTTGSYKIDFAKGQVGLKLTSQSGRLVGFDFEGATIQKASLAVRNARYAAFGVSRFEFLSPTQDQPNPQGAVYPLGSIVRYRFLVQGLNLKNGGYYPRIDVALRDAHGQVVSAKAGLVDRMFVGEADAPPVVTIKGQAAPPTPGTYQLAFRVTDVHSGKSLDYAQGVTVVAP